jgi:hypothetical protein
LELPVTCRPNRGLPKSSSFGGGVLEGDLRDFGIELFGKDHRNDCALERRQQCGSRRRGKNKEQPNLEAASGICITSMPSRRMRAK